MGAGASSSRLQLSQQQTKYAINGENGEDVAKLKAELEKARQEISRLKTQISKSDVLQRFESHRKVSVLVSSPATQPGRKSRRVEVSAETRSEKFEFVAFPKSKESASIIEDAVEMNLLFKGLSADEKKFCVDAFQELTLKEGEEATTQGDVGNKFFVIEEGTLVVLVSHYQGKPPVPYGELSRGESFGELSLMYNTPRAATVQATCDCKLWCIDRGHFRAIQLHHKMKRKNIYENYLRKVPNLSSLTSGEISRLAEAVEEEEFETDACIIREGEVGNIFYIIASGSVEYRKRGEGIVGEGKAGDFFGHKALLTEETRAATVFARNGPVLCLTMGRNDFVNLLGSLEELTTRPQEMTQETASKREGEEEYKHKKDIAFEQLEMLFPSTKGLDLMKERILGQGAFGKVQIVKHKHSGETFALKILNKNQIVMNGLESHVVDERKVMLLINHPFLLQLYNSYWDSYNVYFLLELCLGGELFSILRKSGRFQEKMAKFYTATVLKAFEHLHSKSIVYRDLKPENLLLDDQGYIKVVDFGLAKVVTDKTWTLCGTPDYLAPEIILSKGHDKGVDYWAVGVLTFEMIAGNVPFLAEDPLEVYQLILDGDLKFPSHFSRSCCDFIRKLLNPVQSRRLGKTRDGINAVIRHRFFSGFDWEGLLARTYPPPIQPSVKSPEDTSNFDEFFFSGDDEDLIECDWAPPFPHEVR